MASRGSATIAATAQGVVQGDHNTVTLHYDYRGAVVNQPDRQPSAPRRLPPPVQMLPAPFPELLDRVAPITEAMEELSAGRPVEISGPEGIGKSVILRNLCWRLEIAALDGGLVFMAHRSEPVDDLLQSLFEAFYDVEQGFRPVGPPLRRYLQDIRALVVVDDLSLDRLGLETLRNSLPRCTLVLAADTVQLLEGASIPLDGLPDGDARALLEVGLHRPLTAEELPGADRLSRALGGNPRELLQAAALVRRGSTTLRDLARRFEHGRGSGPLGEALIATTTPGELDIVRTLAALGDVPVRAPHLEALSGLRGVEGDLESLRERGLVEAHSPAYTVAENVGAALQTAWDRGDRGRPVGYEHLMIEHLVRWIDRAEAADLLDDRQLIMSAIGWAGRAGRWREALVLCRGIEGSLMAAGRLGDWQLVLEAAATAAVQLGDVFAQGWTLHQLGTLSLCHEDYAAAQSLLSRALALRERAVDTEGALVTRHNLDVLARLAAPPAQGSPPSTSHVLGWKLLLLLLPLVGLGALGAIVITSQNPPPIAGQPSATVTATPPATTTQLPTQRPTTPRPTVPPSPGSPSSRPPAPPVALTVDSAAPAVGQGATGRSVTVGGQGFQGGTRVAFGAGTNVQSTSTVSATSMTASISVASDATPGRRDVVVTNADGRSASCSGCLVINPAPVIRGVDPDGVWQGTTTTVTAYGSGFSGASVNFSGGGLTLGEGPQGANAVKVQVRVAIDAAGGWRDVTVVNDDGGTATLAEALDVLSGGPPPPRGTPTPTPTPTPTSGPTVIG